ncbi:MAG: ATP synthase F0 subunit B [Chloroflexi bacterium]|nr:ATP synthase F0 subunit B [Chloroflexota bacterium]
MDILHLVDRLEELFNSGRHFPFTNDTIVNEDRFLELIDQLRVTIPEEVKKAQQVLAQRDRLLAQAQEESQRTVELGRQRIEALVTQDAITTAAQARAEQILSQARQEVEGMRRDADDYVLESLSKLEAEITHLLSQVRNGIAKINSERGGLTPPDFPTGKG